MSAARLHIRHPRQPSAALCGKRIKGHQDPKAKPCESCLRIERGAREKDPRQHVVNPHVTARALCGATIPTRPWYALGLPQAPCARCDALDAQAKLRTSRDVGVDHALSHRAASEPTFAAAYVTLAGPETTLKALTIDQKSEIDSGHRAQSSSIVEAPSASGGLSAAVMPPCEPIRTIASRRMSSEVKEKNRVRQAQARAEGRVGGRPRKLPWDQMKMMELLIG